MSENYNEGQNFDTSGGQPTAIKVFPWGSATIGQIAGALAKAQGAMHNPSKAKKVEQKRWSKAENKYIDASYMYASLNEIQNAARQALAENGISVFQPVSGDIQRIEITTVLMHSSGEWMATEPLFSTPVGYSDKGPSVQDMGSLITYLRRYSLCSALNLSAAEDDTDGKTEEEEQKPPTRSQQQAQRKDEKPAVQPAKPKDYSQLPSKDKPAAQPAQETAKPAADTAELDKAKDEFSKALSDWIGSGVTKDFMEQIGKQLTDSCAICSQDTDQWRADDYYLFMTRMDFEAARVEWTEKGLPEDGLKAIVDGLADAKEINSNFIDRLDVVSYNKLMDVVDGELGITKE